MLLVKGHTANCCHQFQIRQVAKFRNLSSYNVAYQIPKNLQPTNFQKIVNLQTFCLNKPTNTNTQKPAKVTT